MAKEQIIKRKGLLFKAITIFFTLTIIVTLVGCNDDGQSAFVGKWETEDGSKAPSGLPDDLELFKDGTGVVEKMTISWKVENKRFVITSSLFGSAYNYEILGKNLTLTDDDGKIAKYIKK
ncbi:MAG: hypothetical protein LBC75_01560 [Fibromonadaceae bacterium]|jgi:uncharacterized lipoprotein NlpE involved in copper resistance|nr:hypothetical protein [Fibromonadaceae bacterium]